MSIFGQSRYYFNEVLPYDIVYGLDKVGSFLGQFWWIFLLVIVGLFVYNMRVFSKNVQAEQNFRDLDNYLKALSQKEEIREIKTFLLQSMHIFKAGYGAVYELRGETYILVESNISDNKNVNAPLRLGRRDLSRFKKSGNFKISYFISSSEKSMIVLFSSHIINTQKYSGHFKIALGFYESVLKNFNAMSGEALLNVSKDTSVSLMKLQMDKYQFFRFFIALVVKITKAMGAKLLTKDGELVFEYPVKKGAFMQKIFYIRNTPYKLEFYDDKPVDTETIIKVGSFLDMAGSFLVNIDKNSEMVQNYLNLLKFTNRAIELENIYYKNHSAIVQIVSFELAKSLFLSENEIDTISLGAYLHDIGMVGDLLAILDKDEFGEQDKNLIKEHPLIGSIMVEPIGHIYPISEIVKYHHERFDGKGYPFGLKESEIPLSAQIVALGEFYAGITGDRSYKKGVSHKEAIVEIEKLKGKMFSPIMVTSFLDIEKSLSVKIDKIKAKSKKDEK